MALSRRTRTPGKLCWLLLVPWPIAYNAFGLESMGRQLLVATVLSLPWLVATAIASHRLRVALRAGAGQPAAAPPTGPD